MFTINRLIAALALIVVMFPAIAGEGVSSAQTTVLIDEDWKFHRGGAQGAEALKFDDSGWRKVDLPHDWSIEDLPGTQSPFSRDAVSQVSGGFTTGGTGWYRKVFTIPNEQQGKRIVVQFDGVYMNAEVWLNGQFLGTHPYGYTSFWFDVTDEAKLDANVLAVKVMNEGENSRWYSGSGIYRHVLVEVIGPGSRRSVGNISHNSNGHRILSQSKYTHSG